MTGNSGAVPGALTRVLLIDDHEVVRRGLRSMVDAHEGFVVCGEASDGRSGVNLAKTLCPDIVVMDVAMPQLNGLEATRQILENSPATQVLVLSMHESEHVVSEVIAAGARGYVLKSAAARDLIEALLAMRQNKTFFTSSIAEVVHRSYLRSPGPSSQRRKLRSDLTRRENEVLQLLAEGNSNKEVAESLGLSVKTAETHRARIMRKLKLDSIAELVRYALRNELIDL
jgi:DNA-binding NarL/FixJ family response regulator